MFGSIFNLGNLEEIFSNPITIVFTAFQIWMLIDAFRRQEWMWVIFLLVFPYINAVLYYFLIYRNASPAATRGFELPGLFNRKLIKQLQGQIYHLDKAHHHAELGDIYFSQGKLKEAEIC